MSAPHKVAIGDATLYCGDARQLIPELPFIGGCVTSPPYWGAQRDYGYGEQLGHEREPHVFVESLVEILSPLREKISGALWLNLGDSYAASGKGGGGSMMAVRGYQWGNRAHLRGWRSPPSGFKEKDLVGIPFAVAFALRADGWTLRRDVIWHKGAATEPTRADRPATSHEFLFLLSSAPDYPFDGAGLPHGTVWHIRPRGYDGHPAAFPEELARVCVSTVPRRAGLVVDPFMGSGTTGVACMNLGRKFIGIEIEERYFHIACERIEQAQKQGKLFEDSA